MSTCPIDVKLTQYTKQLHNFIIPEIVTGFYSMFNKIKDCFSNTPLQELLDKFRAVLKDVRKWTDEMIDNETKHICTKTKLDDYLVTLFNTIMTLKILILVSLPEKQRDRIKFPSDLTFNRFIYNIYLNSAEVLYNNVNVITLSDQTHLKTIIENSLNKSLDLMVPLKYVLTLNNRSFTETKDYRGIENSVVYSVRKNETHVQRNINEENEIHKDDILVNENSIIDINKVREPIIKEPMTGGRGSHDKGTNDKGNHDKETNDKGNHVKENSREEHKIVLEGGATDNETPNDIRNRELKESSKYTQDVFNKKALKTAYIKQNDKRCYDESEPYCKSKNYLDVFSNRQYSPKIPAVPENSDDNSDVKTSEIEKYALGYNKSKVNNNASDTNSSIKNYIEKNKNDKKLKMNKI